MLYISDADIISLRRQNEYLFKLAMRYPCVNTHIQALIRKIQKEKKKIFFWAHIAHSNGIS